jgi:Staphylococcal nuclease homologue
MIFTKARVGIVVVVLANSVCFAAEISGLPRIVDGDTVQIGSTKIRFAGIDAPETDQVCLDGKGERWACGITSRDELIKYSAGRPWECDLIGTDRYGRALGKCFVESEDISAWMVRSGWALSFVRYSHEYDRDEAAAREAQGRTMGWRFHCAMGLATPKRDDPGTGQAQRACGRAENAARCGFIRWRAIARLHDQSKRGRQGVYLSPARRPLVREDEDGFGQALVLLPH